MSDRYSENRHSNRTPDDYGDGYTTNRRSGGKSDNSRYGDCFDGYEDIYSHSSAGTRSARSGRNPEEKSKKKRKGFLAKLLCVILVVVLLLVGVLGIFMFKVINSINYVELDEVYEGHYQDADGVSLASDSKVQNILIFGVDEASNEYGRSDSMMLLSIDKVHSKLKVTSFQRDTFVYVPDPDGDYRTKLTNAYSYGGVGLALKTIEANYGVQIDRYVTVNFDTFKTIVDIMGGVELELTDREILYINCQIAQNKQTEYLDAQAGTVLLNGQQALWHARNRGGDVINGVAFYEGTDWDRTQRQRQLLEAIVDDMHGVSFVKLLQIANGVAPYITTNMSRSELFRLILNSPKYLGYEVVQCSMPSDGTWEYTTNFAGDVIYVNNWPQVQSDLRQFIYEDQDDT